MTALVISKGKNKDIPVQWQLVNCLLILVVTDITQRIKGNLWIVGLFHSFKKASI